MGAPRARAPEAVLQALGELDERVLEGGLLGAGEAAEAERNVVVRLQPRERQRRELGRVRHQDQAQESGALSARPVIHSASRSASGPSRNVARCSRPRRTKRLSS